MLRIKLLQKYRRRHYGSQNYTRQRGRVVVRSARRWNLPTSPGLEGPAGPCKIAGIILVVKEIGNLLLGSVYTERWIPLIVRVTRDKAWFRVSQPTRVATPQLCSPSASSPPVKRLALQSPLNSKIAGRIMKLSASASVTSTADRETNARIVHSELREPRASLDTIEQGIFVHRA